MRGVGHFIIHVEIVIFAIGDSLFLFYKLFDQFSTNKGLQCSGRHLIINVPYLSSKMVFFERAWKILKVLLFCFVK